MKKPLEKDFPTYELYREAMRKWLEIEHICRSCEEKKAISGDTWCRECLNKPL